MNIPEKNIALIKIQASSDAKKVHPSNNCDENLKSKMIK